MFSWLKRAFSAAQAAPPLPLENPPQWPPLLPLPPHPHPLPHQAHLLHHLQPFSRPALLALQLALHQRLRQLPPGPSEASRKSSASPQPTARRTSKRRGRK